MSELDPPFGAPLRQDFCWKRVGWHWEVWSFKLDRWGSAVFSERAVPLKFWRWRSAATVSNAVFCAYLDGKETQKKLAPLPPAHCGPAEPIENKGGGQ